jgi:protein-L-isoaspartate(D-aspartate) O-methyltransferase
MIGRIVRRFTEMTPDQAARKMVQQQLAGRGIRDPRVLEAMRCVPRHQFVPESSIDVAYADRALPTRNGQTISQPYIVARMTELLTVEPGSRVLEVGAGSGYQLAVLAAMGAEVFGVERDPDLLAQARTALDQMPTGANTDRIHLMAGDGTRGWPAQAPFDRILITAAAPALPEPVAGQLADPGRAVLPIGDQHHQVLTLIDHRDGQWVRTEDTACRFVPLLGAFGFSEAGG